MTNGSIATTVQQLEGYLIPRDIDIAVDRIFYHMDLDQPWFITINVNEQGEEEYSASVDVEDDEFDLQINTSNVADRREALECLYHELTHIRQYLEGRDPFGPVSTQESYLTDPLEIEAREYENYEHDHHNYF